MDVGPGGYWAGDYIVVDFDHFWRHLHDGRVVAEQQVKEVYCEQEQATSEAHFVFPIRAAYERQTREVPLELVVPSPVGEMPKGAFLKQEWLWNMLVCLK